MKPKRLARRSIIEDDEPASSVRHEVFSQEPFCDEALTKVDLEDIYPNIPGKSYMHFSTVVAFQWVAVCLFVFYDRLLGVE